MTWLCAQCRRKLTYVEQKCIVCEETNHRGTTCISCRSETRLAGVVSAGAYSNTSLRRGLHWLKFKGVREASTALAELLVPQLKLIAPWLQLQQQAVLIPLPLHRRRERERGFNQSALLAATISRYTSMPVVAALERQRATLTQTKLPSGMRLKNMREAFRQVKSLPRSKKLALLVDDVTTTGASLNAAAAPLPEDVQIWGVTVARG